MNKTKKTSVSFDVNNETIRGDLYTPTTPTGLIPGIVVVGPMTSVKEQVTGVYAQAMAKLGFAALAIDHRHYGESGGQPRQFEYYKHKIEDIVAAVDFISGREEIDPEHIGLVGICLGCGYASWASVKTKKAKWMGLVVGYFRDVDAIKADDPKAFEAKVEQGVQAREHFNSTGESLTIPAASKDVDAAMTSESLVDYYTRRAYIDNYKNEFALMSREHFLTFDIQSAAKKIIAPVYMVHSESALSPSFAKSFYGNLQVAKKQLWLSGECQDDFYDNEELVRRSSLFIAQHGRET